MRGVANIPLFQRVTWLSPHLLTPLPHWFCTQEAEQLAWSVGSREGVSRGRVGSAGVVFEVEGREVRAE